MSATNKSNLTVLEIIREYLKKNGFDGLYNRELGCGCSINNLNPCGDINIDCTAGYQVEAPPGADYDDYICGSKNDKPWKC